MFVQLRALRWDLLMYEPPNNYQDPLNRKATADYYRERFRRGFPPIPGVDLLFTLLKIVFLSTRWVVKSVWRLSSRAWQGEDG